MSAVTGVQLTNYKIKKDLLGSEVRLSGQLVCHTEQQVATVWDHLPALLSPTHAEPGYRSFNVTSTRDPMIGQVEERFEHAAAFEAHQERLGSRHPRNRTPLLSNRRADLARLGTENCTESRALDWSPKVGHRI